MGKNLKLLIGTVIGMVLGCSVMMFIHWTTDFSTLDAFDRLITAVITIMFGFLGNVIASEVK